MTDWTDILGAEPEWGAILRPDGTARFRLWAPACEALTLRHGGEDAAMEPVGDGWFEVVRPAAAGDAYAFVLPDGMVVPDPAAFAQAGDVHGPSTLVAPAERPRWAGRPWHEAVISEVHVGTFTEEGTLRSAIRRLDHLAEAGITCVELLPLSQFSGERGWGYDGVLLYAPHPAYGTPEDVRAFVAAAHERGLMVLIDLVHNHFGPEGNYLHAYAPDFFDPSRETPWGAAIAYAKAPVRRFFIENAVHWLQAYGFDGIRFDAIDHIRDPSDPEILIEMAEEIRDRITDRPIHLTTEDNRNVTHLHERGEAGLVPHHTAEWNDDMHNAAHVIATGEQDGYYADYAEAPAALLAAALARGYAYDGRVSPTTGAPRGQPAGHLPPTAFIDFLQNHDQVGNRALGERLISIAPSGMLRTLTAILLLSPHVPMLFMGEEYGETRPFLFFADFEGDLARSVTEGRRREFAGFEGFSGQPEDIPDPIARRTFLASKLDWAHAADPQGRAHLEETRALLRLRAERIAPLLEHAPHGGEVLDAPEGVVAVDWPLGGGTLRLRANLGDDAARWPEAAGEVLHALGAPGAPGSMAMVLEAA